MTETLEKPCPALHRNLCISLYLRLLEHHTFSDSGTFSYYGLSLQENFYYLKQFHMLTGTPYI